MLTVDEALGQIQERVERKAAIKVPLDQGLGRMLAEEITCDRDSPPWDKAMVDGYAVVASDLSQGVGSFTVIEEIVAGATPTQAVRPGEATRIMTGAPIPQGCDAVVMVERTRIVGSGSPEQVEISEQARAGQNILRRGAAMRAGESVLPAGKMLRAIELGLLAEVGRAEVHVVPTPRVAVLSTGNELAPAGAMLSAGQIRNSNGPMLLAAARELQAEAIDLGIVRDEAPALRAAITQGLQADVLVLSGGVSAGVLDLVPQLLAELGVEQVFHKLSLKPGKPMWFGVRPAQRSRCLVFGLPGNPVSSYVCFHLFVRRVIEWLAGRPDSTKQRAMALGSEFKHRGDRPTFHPGRVTTIDGASTIELVRWRGSADLYGLSQADALIHFPAGNQDYAAGDKVEVVVL